MEKIQYRLQNKPQQQKQVISRSHDNTDFSSFKLTCFMSSNNPVFLKPNGKARDRDERV